MQRTILKNQSCGIRVGWTMYVHAWLQSQVTVKCLGLKIKVAHADGTYPGFHSLTGAGVSVNSPPPPPIIHCGPSILLIVWQCTERHCESYKLHVLSIYPAQHSGPSCSIWTPIHKPSGHHRSPWQPHWATKMSFIYVLSKGPQKMKTVEMVYFYKSYHH